MGLMEALAASHAADFLARADTDLGDPRDSRVPLLRAAHAISDAIQQSPSAQRAVLQLEDVLHAQVASSAALVAAASVGSPHIEGLPAGPANLLYAAGRLAAHAASASSSSSAMQTGLQVPPGDELATLISGVAASLEPEFTSCLLTEVADKLLNGDQTFALRMAQAAQDVGVLIQSGDELPQFLLQLLKDHDSPSGGDTGGGSTRDLLPRSAARPVNWTNPLRSWIAPQLRSEYPPSGDEGDGGGAAGGEAGGGAIICAASVASGTVIVPVIVCVVVVVIVVVVLISNKRH